MKKYLKMVLLLSLVFSCTKKSGETASSAGKPFVYCSEGSPSTFNPQTATDGTTANASSETVYNRLVEFKYGTTLIEPGLAESWTINDAGTEYIFNLRKNVKFHKTKFFTPSRDFNADDVIFSIDRQRVSTHPYHKVNGGGYEYFGAMEMGSAIKEVIKLNDHQIKVVLSKPEAPFLANLGMAFMSILSKEYGENLMKKGTPEKIDFYPVGTGPFVFEEYQKDSFIRFNAHPNYWKSEANIKKLIFAITKDASVRFQKLRTGECDFVTFPSPADLKKMRKDPNIDVMEQPGLNIAYLAFNVEKKPFNDVRVRKAISYALNKKSYIDAIYLGNAVPATNPIPPTMWSYNKKVADYDFNIETAKKLLADAGYKKGFETELWTLPVSRPYIPNGKKLGELMQADLAKIGIKVKLVSYDWPTYLAKSKVGEHQMIQFGWTGDNGDPDNFLGTLLGCAAVKAGANRSRWCDTKFNGLIEQAKRVAEIDQRSKLYENAQQIFKDKAPWVTLVHSITHRAMRSNVKGFKMDPLGLDNFYEVEVKK